MSHFCRKLHPLISRNKAAMFICILLGNDKFFRFSMLNQPTKLEQFFKTKMANISFFHYQSTQSSSFNLYQLQSVKTTIHGLFFCLITTIWPMEAKGSVSLSYDCWQTAFVRDSQKYLKMFVVVINFLAWVSPLQFFYFECIQKNHATCFLSKYSQSCCWDFEPNSLYLSPESLVSCLEWL